MTTIDDLIPMKVFSTIEFRQYKRDVDDAVKNAGSISGLIFIVIACVLFFGPFLATYYTISQDPSYNTIMGLTTCFLLSFLAGVIPGIVGITLADCVIKGAAKDKYAEMTNDTLPIWQEKYTTAWNNIIVPNMINSLTKFQKFSDQLPKDSTNTTAYVEMYKLSESIKQHINDKPLLNIHTRFDYTPAFITLNNMIDSYTPPNRPNIVPHITA